MKKRLNKTDETILDLINDYYRIMDNYNRNDGFYIDHTGIPFNETKEEALESVKDFSNRVDVLLWALRLADVYNQNEEEEERSKNHLIVYAAELAIKSRTCKVKVKTA